VVLGLTKLTLSFHQLCISAKYLILLFFLYIMTKLHSICVMYIYKIIGNK
jgi:hypothetical protein